MKGFKNYEQQYKSFYGVERAHFNLKNFSLYQNNPDNLDEYAIMLRNTATEMERVIFVHVIKLFWLLGRLKYAGNRRTIRRNGRAFDMAFSYYLRKYVGIEPKIFFGKANAFNKILTYVEDFFPNFDECNPFVEKLEYPFTYMSFGCLTLVHKMDERLDLLNYGENKAMNYGTFIDYVVNYINCYNDEHGKKYAILVTNCENAPLKIKKYE
jgi:hypothetical protein